VERVRLRETGVTGTILAAKAGNGVDVDRVLASFDFGPPEAANDGWFISANSTTPMERRTTSRI